MANRPTERASEMTPEKIAGQEFAHSFRGYDVSDVRGFLARVAGEVRRVEEALGRARAELAEASDRPPPGIEDLSRDQLNQLLGEEAARVLRTADDAARDIRTRAEDNVERMLHEAQAEAREIRAEAERIREEARAEADSRISEAEEIVATRLAEADAEALRRREAVVEDGRAMLAEARAARERMLVDLAERRRDSRRELYQLRAGIEQLRESYDELRSMLDRSVVVVDTAEEDARRAAGYAAERFDRDDMTDDRAELGRELGLESEPSPPSPPQVIQPSSRTEMEEGEPEAAGRGSGGAEAVGWTTAELQEGAAEHQAEAAEAGSEPAPAEATGVTIPELGITGTIGSDEHAAGPTAEAPEASGPQVAGEPQVTQEAPESQESEAAQAAPESQAAAEAQVSEVEAVAQAAAEAEETVSRAPGDEPVEVDEMEPDGAEEETPAVEVSDESVPVGDSGDSGGIDTTVPESSAPEAADAEGSPLFDQDHEVGDTPADRPADPPGRQRSRIIYRREPRPDSTLAGIVASGSDGEGSDSPVLEELQAALDRAVAAGETPAEPGGGEPLTDPALVAVESALSAVELDEVFGGSTNFTRDDTAPGPLGGPHAEIDELFARIREARETSVSRAREVMDRSTAAEAAAVPDPAVETAANPAADAAANPVPDTGRGGLEDVEALFRRQDQVRSSVEKKISRFLKRGLADQLNEVLDAIRRNPEPPDIDEVLPAESVTAIASGLRSLLVEAVLEGAGRFDGSEDDLGPQTRGVLDDLVATVAADMNGSLRSRLETFLGDVATAESGARGLYREWRRESLAPLARDIVLAAYAAGVVDQLPPGSDVTWVTPEGGCVHPDCADNALATGVRLGSPFPSGHVRSPLAPGCRCLVVSAGS